MSFTSDQVIKQDGGQGIAKGDDLSLKDEMKEMKLVPDSTCQILLSMLALPLKIKPKASVQVIGMHGLKIYCKLKSAFV